MVSSRCLKELTGTGVNPLPGQEKQGSRLFSILNCSYMNVDQGKSLNLLENDLQ